jgi:hypothetical protein
MWSLKLLRNHSGATTSGINAIELDRRDEGKTVA